jgi:hypothetical protein
LKVAAEFLPDIFIFVSARRIRDAFCICSHARPEGGVKSVAILIVLAVLLVITFLVGFPIYASIIAVPVFLARKAFGAFESEIVESYQEEEA